MIRFRLLMFLSMTGLLPAQNALYLDIRDGWRQSPDDRAAYAAPSFDDSSWPRVSLPLDERSMTPDSRPSWLRRKIDLPGGAKQEPLVLTLGAIRRTYDVYVNGRILRSIEPTQQYALIPRPLTLDLPAEASAAGSIVIALRLGSVVTSHPYWMLPDEGPYVLTGASLAPRDEGRRQMERRWITVSPSVAFGLAFGVIGAISLMGWRMEPTRRELFWFGLACAVRTFRSISQTTILLADVSPFEPYGVPVGFFSGNLEVAALAEFALSALCLHLRVVRTAVWLLCGLVFASLPSFGKDLSIPAGALVQVLTAALILAVVGANGWRTYREGREDREQNLIQGALAVALMARVIVWVIVLAGLVRARIDPAQPVNWRQNYLMLGSFWVEYDDVFWLAVSITLLVLLFRRFQTHRQERQRLANELEAARIVQQLILPRTSMAGVEAVYHPAAEVGGDFWQCYSVGDNDGKLIVAGDVSGKGLRAAMVVSLITGVLQNRHSNQPGPLLSELNEALCGKLDIGFVTAVALLVGDDGQVKISSAGHPAPYWNGAEGSVEAGLPLGLAPGIVYAESAAKLGPNEQLTLLSDGVLEAANSRGELFGFDRTRSISTQSARAIAEAALAWGQNDDITVVTVRRSSL